MSINLHNIQFYEERKDLAAAFRWAERLNLHEAVANHFSLAVNDQGTKFLMNPNRWHFSRIKASDLLLLDANNPPPKKTITLRLILLHWVCIGKYFYLKHSQALLDNLGGKDYFL